MRSRRLVLLLLASSMLAVAADDRIDPSGWTKAKWGMTDADILQAFDGDAVRLATPEKVSGIRINVAIEQIEITGVKFKALMIPAPDGKLKNVLLSPRKGEQEDPSLFRRLQDLLVRKYGRPWLNTVDHTTDAQWTLPTTVITLTMTSLPAMNFCVSLKYAQKPDAPI